MSLKNTSIPWYLDFPDTLRIVGPYDLRVNWFLSCVIGLSFLLSAVTNSLILNTFRLNRKLITPSNTYIIILVVTDLTVAVVGYPFDYYHYSRGYYASPQVLCKIYGFFVFFAGHHDIFVIMLIAIDRYLAIAKPLLKMKLGKKFLVVGMSISVTHCLLWSVLPLLGISNYTVGYEGITCSVDFEDRTPLGILYLVSILFLAWVTPLSICTFCYVNVFQTLKKINAKSLATSEEQSQINRKVEVKMAKVGASISLGLFIAWSPYAIACFSVLILGADKVPTIFLVIPAAFAKTGIAINPIIFLFTNGPFREEMFKTFLPKQSNKGEQETDS